ncbi:hypothetical protein SR1949_15010 [Sphaerospermopsis reniformis]|uniref:Uncharacterized protein n=1 Tax=Sphaerospermopsis reniformis TaxID=531300 RepID=A0A479ZV24_9CYAN|nr:hypothetical protein SR1949_15010 [Sphaerospermopsis reniformis]
MGTSKTSKTSKLRITNYELQITNFSKVILSGKELCAPNFVVAKAPAAAPQTTASFKGLPGLYLSGFWLYLGLTQFI